MFELTPRCCRSLFFFLTEIFIAVGRAVEDWQKKEPLKLYITFIFKLQDKVLPLVEYSTLGVSLSTVA